MQRDVLLLTEMIDAAEQAQHARRAHSERWTDTGLVFTTRYGTPIEPHSALLRIAASLSSWS